MLNARHARKTYETLNRHSLQQRDLQNIRNRGTLKIQEKINFLQKAFHKRLATCSEHYWPIVRNRNVSRERNYMILAEGLVTLIPITLET